SACVLHTYRCFFFTRRRRHTTPKRGLEFRRVLFRATRNCIAVIHDGGQQTEILEGGPEIKLSEAQDFMQKFRSAVKEVELVTMSGSLPQGLDKGFYNQLLTIAKENDTPVLLDTGGALLEKALHHDDKPFLIKPNETEIADLLGENLTTD